MIKETPLPESKSQCKNCQELKMIKKMTREGYQTRNLYKCYEYFYFCGAECREIWEQIGSKTKL